MLPVARRQWPPTANCSLPATTAESDLGRRAFLTTRRRSGHRPAARLLTPVRDRPRPAGALGTVPTIIGDVTTASGHDATTAGALGLRNTCPRARTSQRPSPSKSPKLTSPMLAGDCPTNTQRPSIALEAYQNVTPVR